MRSRRTELGGGINDSYASPTRIAHIGKKLKQVTFLVSFNIIILAGHSDLSFFLQIYRGRNDSEKHHILYWCPLAYLCGCRTQFKLLLTRDNVELRSSGTHDGMSHVEDKSKYLTNAQKSTLKRSTKSAPNETGRAHVHNSCNFSPDKRTPERMQLLLGSRHTGVGQGVHGRWEMQVLAMWRTTMAWRAICPLLYRLFVGQQARING